MLGRMDEGDSGGQARRTHGLRRHIVAAVLTCSAIGAAAVHVIKPDLKIDGITVVLLVVAAVPWLGDLFDSIELPGGAKFQYAQLVHRIEAGEERTVRIGRADRALLRGAEFMSSRGLVHFDAHFHNVLTDGELIHFADFGLALSTRFELAPDEARFLSEHLGDRAYTASHLLRYHLPGADERDDLAHEAFLREWIAGRGRGGVPAEAAALLDRHAATGLLMAGFHRRLVTESKRTPFPAAEVAEASR